MKAVRAEYPKALANARMRGYGFPGRRQARWIKARDQLTADEVRDGHRFDDAAAGTAWPIEVHDRITGMYGDL